MNFNDQIRRHHHITLSVGGAQEYYDFHTQVLGLKSVKKTALYDGDEPIHHLCQPCMDIKGVKSILQRQVVWTEVTLRCPSCNIEVDTTERERV